jgi:hypothetical protein
MEPTMTQQDAPEPLFIQASPESYHEIDAMCQSRLQHFIDSHQDDVQTTTAMPSLMLIEHEILDWRIILFFISADTRAYSVIDRKLLQPTLASIIAHPADQPIYFVLNDNETGVPFDKPVAIALLNELQEKSYAHAMKNAEAEIAEHTYPRMFSMFNVPDDILIDIWERCVEHPPVAPNNYALRVQELPQRYGSFYMTLVLPDDIYIGVFDQTMMEETLKHLENLKQLSLMVLYQASDEKRAVLPIEFMQGILRQAQQQLAMNAPDAHVESTTTSHYLQ